MFLPSSPGHSPVTVITYEDKVKSQQDHDDAFEKASAATGSPRDRTFFITNYTHDNKEYSMTTEKSALDILDTVLYSAERFVNTQKLTQEFYNGNASSGSECSKGSGKSLKFIHYLPLENDSRLFVC